MTISDEYKGSLHTLGDCPNVLLSAWEIPLEKSGNRKSQISAEAGRGSCSSHSAEQYPSQSLGFLLLALLLCHRSQKRDHQAGEAHLWWWLWGQHSALKSAWAIISLGFWWHLIFCRWPERPVISQVWICCSKRGADLATFPPMEVELTTKSPIGFTGTTQRKKRDVRVGIISCLLAIRFSKL